MLEGIAGPVMSGIFSADPADLSMASTFPRLQELEWKYGSLIRGLLAEKRKHAAASNHAPPPPMFMGFKSGMSALSRALEDRLTGDLRTHASVGRISPKEGGGFVLHGVDGEVIEESDAVLCALPARAASRVLKESSPLLARELDEISYSDTVNAYLAFPDDAVPNKLDGFGFVIPEREARNIRSCTFSSTKFPGRAPEGMRLVRTFLSNARQREMIDAPDAEVIRVVRADLKDLLGIEREPVLQQVFRWPSANPQYRVGHLDRVRRIEERAAEVPGLYLCGSSFGGVGVPDVIAGAHHTVAALVES